MNLSRNHCVPLLLLVLVLITGCASTKPPVKFPLTTDYTAQITGSFNSLPNYTRIYFQHGKRISTGNRDKWTTYCRLHVFNPERKADYLTQVEPGQFAVTSVRLRRDSSDGNFTQSPLAYNDTANPKTTFDFFSGLISFPSYYLYRVILKLESAGQPDVQTLICSRKWGSKGNHYPTLADIQTALGDHILLKSE